MKLHLVAASVLAAASLCAGCAQDQGTGAMGAGPQGMACNDGAVVPSGGSCAAHGGVARPARQQRSSPAGGGYNSY